MKEDKQKYIEGLERQLERIKKDYSALQEESQKNSTLRGLEPIKIYQEIEDIERRIKNALTALKAPSNQVRPVIQAGNTLLFEDITDLINKLFYLYRFHSERSGNQDDVIFCQYQEV